MSKFFGKVHDLVMRSRYAIAFACALAFGGLSAFAEESGENAIDLKPATDALKAAKEKLIAWVGENAEVLGAILGGTLVITLIFVVYGWIRRASKGR